ncbi:MAG: hypothetical protein VXX89_04250 [Pseudomonadota bacterium]|nr:hypothetical protein [Pseudomonadota bacterium]
MQTHDREELAWGKSIDKSRILSFIGGAICLFLVWDTVDYLIGGLGFPRGEWETYISFLYLVLLPILALLMQEKVRKENDLVDKEDD